MGAGPYPTYLKTTAPPLKHSVFATKKEPRKCPWDCKKSSLASISHLIKASTHQLHLIVFQVSLTPSLSFFLFLSLPLYFFVALPANIFLSLFSHFDSWEFRSVWMSGNSGENFLSVSSLDSEYGQFLLLLGFISCIVWRFLWRWITLVTTLFWKGIYFLLVNFEFLGLNDFFGFVLFLA